MRVEGQQGWEHWARGFDGFDRFGPGWFGPGWFWGETENLREIDAEEAAERAQGAASGVQRLGRGGGEGGQGGRVVQEKLQLGRAAGDVIAEDADEPGIVAGEADGGRPALGAGTRGLGAREPAGGEAGKQDGEPAMGAADAGVNREEICAELGKAGVDEQEERGENRGQARGEVERPRVGCAGSWLGVGDR